MSVRIFYDTQISSISSIIDRFSNWGFVLYWLGLSSIYFLFIFYFWGKATPENRKKTEMIRKHREVKMKKKFIEEYKFNAPDAMCLKLLQLLDS